MSTASKTLVFTDSQSRLLEVRYRTRSGNAAWSAWTVKTSPYSFTVTLSATAFSRIEWEIDYTDCGGDTATLENGVDFPPEGQVALDAASYTTSADETATLANSRQWEDGDGTAVDTGTAGKISLNVSTALRDAIVAFTIGDGTNVIPAGLWDLIRVPAGTIIEVALAGKEASGSIVLDLWLDTYANLDPTVADTITASAKPTITASKKYKDTTLTGWSPTIAADSWLGLNVDSASTFTLVRGYLIVRRS